MKKRTRGRRKERKGKESKGHLQTMIPQMKKMRGRKKGGKRPLGM